MEPSRRYELQYLSTDELAEIAERLGHLTVWHFSGGWKAALGTVELSAGNREYFRVLRLRTAPTLHDALADLLAAELPGDWLAEAPKLERSS